MIAATKRQRNHYDEDFKRNAVKTLLDSGKPVTTVASQLGIEQSNLHKWSKRYAHEFFTSEQQPDNHTELRLLKAEIREIKTTVETLRTIILKSMGDKYLK